MVSALAILCALAVAIAVITGAGWLTWSSLRAADGRGGSGERTAVGVGDGSGKGTGASAADVAAVSAAVNPAVVTITSTFAFQNASGAGTGIVLTASGEVLTNNHVINGATDIRVTDVGNGRTYVGTVAGYDVQDDLAVVQLRGASGLKTAAIGDSTSLRVGQAVVAIGNAGGAGGTPTSAAGAITALNQAITAADEVTGVSERLSGLIEVDANVQPGDSGGPLADASGKVIGVDTAASAGMTFQGASGRGYAIPISTALSVVHQIESGQASDRVHIGATAFLGVLLGTNGGGDGDGEGTGQPGGAASQPGAFVRDVVSGGAAERAGLVAGDVITSVDGRVIDSASSLGAVISTRHPGDRVAVGWVDSGGRSQRASVTLGEGPPA